MAGRDCQQVVIALVVTPEGFPLAYEVMDGNTSDKTTLRGFLNKIETSVRQGAAGVGDGPGDSHGSHAGGDARPASGRCSIWWARRAARVSKYEKHWLDLPWQKVRDSVEVKLFSRGRRIVCAGQERRPAGERDRDPAQEAGALAAEAASHAAQLPEARSVADARRRGQKGSRTRFRIREDQLAAKPARRSRARPSRSNWTKTSCKEAELRDGHYLLRTNLVAEDPAVLWDRYMQLTQIEAAFKCLKSDLGMRPIYHQLEQRVEAHILVAFLAYCLTVTLKHRLQAHAPGLTPRAVLEKLATIQMLDVCLPTTDGRWLIMPRYTEPEPDLALLLHQLNLTLPNQPPPRIAALCSPKPCPQLKM